MDTKKCTICNEILPIDRFRRRTKNPLHSLRNQCKRCEYSQHQEWYKRNRSHVNKWFSIYNKTNKKRKEYNKIHCKNFRDKNKELFYSLIREWNKNNPDKYKAIQYRKDAKKRGAEGSHTHIEIKELYLKQGGECVCCKVNLKKTSYHRDHIVPISKGGNNYITNIQLLCPKCNMEKRDKDSIIFMQTKGFLL